LLKKGEEMRDRTASNPWPKTFRTLDRALALRCKLARDDGKKMTINYETAGGWNRITGVVRSVRMIKTSPLKPLWEIVVEEPK
jgi:hypothetical protein